MTPSTIVRRVPPSVRSVGAGVAVAGLATYVYLVVTARVLGPAAYAPFSAVWALAVTLGAGCYLPFEQELARRAAGGLGAMGAHVLRRGIFLAAGLTAVIALGLAVAAPALLDRVTDGDVLLLISLVLACAAYAVQMPIRGLLSGRSRFGAFALVLGGEAVIRMLVALVLAAAGVAAGGPFGLAIAVGALLSALIGATLLPPGSPTGPTVPLHALRKAIGRLLVAALLYQVLLNFGPVVVKVLADPDEQALAAQFLATVVVVRVPLFLFQSVQATLVPQLAAFGHAGQWTQLRAVLRRLLILVSAFALITVVASVAIGPQVVRLLFGPGFVLGRFETALLAAGVAAAIVAVTLSEALVALQGHQRVALAWAGGVVVATVVVVVVPDLIARVGFGLVAGEVVAGLLLARGVRGDLQRARSIHGA